MVYAISRFLFFLVMKIFFRLEVLGREVIPCDSAFILASNHMSNIDPLALGIACPRKIYFLGKEELFGSKISFWWMKKVGVIPLKRGKNDIGAIKIAIRSLKEGKPLLIFPQGTRSNDFSTALGGVGFLFSKTKLPIVIAKVSGTDRALPKGKKIPRFTKIKVAFKKMGKINESGDYESMSLEILRSIKNI